MFRVTLLFLVVSLGAVVAGIFYGSVLIVNLAGCLMTLIGFVEAVRNYRLEESLRQGDRVRAILAPLLRREASDRQRMELDDHRRDGVLAGLILSTSGSLVSGLSQPLIDLFTYLFKSGGT